MGPDVRRLPLDVLLFAIGFAAATFAVLMPWPRPALSLEACELVPVGRFGFQCDVTALAQRTGHVWLRGSLRVYEDGLRLRDAASVGDAVRIHTGSYYTDGRSLTYSALDGSDPRSNGRHYAVRSLASMGPWHADQPGRRAVAGALLAAAFGVLCLRRRARLRPLLWSTGLAVALACALVQVIAVLKESPVHVDSGYILGAVRSVSAGGVPYASLLYNYTPLGLYEFALWGRLWPGPTLPSHDWYLGFVVLNEAACAVFVFLILRRAGCAGDIAALACTCFFSLTLWFDGARILQEPLYLLPILAAAWLSLSLRVAASGMSGALAAVALLIKQYGGFGLFGLLGSALLGQRDRLRRATTIVLGFVTTLSILTLAMSALDVDLAGLARQALVGGYPRKYETVWLKAFLQACPIALLAVAAPFLPSAWSREGIRVAACFGLASLMPLYFRQHQYYFLNVVPWIFLLFALGVDTLANRMPRRGEPFLHGLAVALLLSMPVRAAVDQATLTIREIRSEQLRRARLMTNAWPAGQRTLMLAYPGFYAITGYRSADEGVLGYRFPHELTAEQLRVGFQRAGGAWIDRRGMYARGADTILRSAGTSLDEELSLNGFEQRLVLEERFELWTKRPPQKAGQDRR